MKPNTFFFDLDDLTGICLTLCPGTDEGKFSEFELYEHYLNLCRIAEHALMHRINAMRHGREPARFLDLPDNVKHTLDIDWDNVDFRNPKFPSTEKRTDKDKETKNMNTKRAAKLLKIANYYGQERQVCKLMEELGEASSAASEVLQLLAFSEDGGKESGIEERLERLASELADVANVTEQILTLFALEVEFKVARQRGVDKTIARIRKELGDET